VKKKEDVISFSLKRETSSVLTVLWFEVTMNDWQRKVWVTSRFGVVAVLEGVDKLGKDPPNLLFGDECLCYAVSFNVFEEVFPFTELDRVVNQLIVDPLSPLSLTSM
jgi:hypothetical protein